MQRKEVRWQKRACAKSPVPDLNLQGKDKIMMQTAYMIVNTSPAKFLLSPNMQDILTTLTM